MKHVPRTILIWILLILTLQILSIRFMRHPHLKGPLIQPGHGYSSPVDVYIFRNGDQITIHEHVVVNGDTANPIGKYTYRIEEKYYPVMDYYELISKRNLQIIINEAVSIPGYRDRLQLTTIQQSNLYGALYSFTLNNPDLSNIKPDWTPTYRIAWNRIWFSLYMFIFYGVISGACMFGYQDMRRSCLKSRTDRRQKCGLCINCAYPIAELPSPDCPECGRRHSSTIETPA